MPATHDHRGQGDETVSGRDVVVLEGSDETDREIGPAETREDPAQQHGLGLGGDHLDPDGVRCPRVLADRPDPQPPLGAVEQEPHQRNRQQGHEGQGALGEQDRPDERDLTQRGNGEHRHGADHTEGLEVAGDELLEDEPRQPGGQQVHDHADDDVIHQVFQREQGQHGPHQETCDGRRGQGRQEGLGDGKPQGLGDGEHHGGREGRGQELALDRDVHHAGALRQDAGQHPEQQRRRIRQREVQLARQGERNSGGRGGPDNETCEDAEPSDHSRRGAAALREPADQEHGPRGQGEQGEEQQHRWARHLDGRQLHIREGIRQGDVPGRIGGERHHHQQQPEQGEENTRRYARGTPLR